MPRSERRPMMPSPSIASILRIGMVLLLCAVEPSAAAPVNQCLGTVCAEGNLNEGAPCRDDADCDLDAPDDGEGHCGTSAFDPNRVFVVNDTADSLCDETTPEECCPSVDPADSGDPCAAATCTLREAVIAANRTENVDISDDPENPFLVDDIIEICPGTYQLSIAGNGEDDALTGDLDLGDSVIIAVRDTMGPRDVVIRGGDDRVFHILPPDPEDEEDLGIAVSLVGMTIENGGGPGFDEPGGGVLNEANLGFVSAILADNEVGDADGGGLHNSETGFFSFSSASILDNRAGGNGGGVSNVGRFSALNSTFTGNVAGGVGGAIYNGSRTTVRSEISGTTVALNDASGGGDGIFNDGNGFRLTNTIVDADACATGEGSCQLRPTVCLDGANAGVACASDAECPESSCRVPAACAGGPDEGTACASDTECEDSTCEDLFACVGGDSEGLECEVDSECIGSLLVSGGGNVESPGATCFRECVGGIDDGDACNVDSDCDLAALNDQAGTCAFSAPVCAVPEGSSDEPLPCDVGSECPGVCTKPQGFCAGAPAEPACTQNWQCSGVCSVDPGTCDGGANAGEACTSNGECPDSTCDGAGSELLCQGGANEGASCASDAECEFPCENQRVCFDGSQDPAVCDQDSDCTASCLPLDECEGGDNMGMVCGSDAECPDSVCVQVSGICGGGVNDGGACLVDDECPPLCGNPATCDGGVDAGQPCDDDPDCGGTCDRGRDQAGIAPGRLLQSLDETLLPVFPLALGAIGQDEPDRNPAVDFGEDAGCLPIDQRGVFRPQDGFIDGGTNCDSGAFEARPPQVEKSAALADDDGDGAPEPGEILEYTVTLTNDREIFAGDLVFNFADALDQDELTNLVVGSTTTTTGVVTDGNDPGGGETEPDVFVRVACGELTPEQSETITYQVEIAEDDPDATGIIVNQGFVTFPGPDDNADLCEGVEDGAPFPGGIFSDDPSTAAIGDATRVALANRADLLVCKSDALEVDLLADGAFNPGDTIRYQIVITNEGQRAARGVLFEDSPHRDTTLLVGSVSVEIDDVSYPGLVVSGNQEGDTDVVVDLGELAERALSTAVIEFVVMINDPIPLGCTDLFNFATLSGDNIETTFSDDPGAEEGETRPAPTRSPVVFSPLADDTVRFKVKLDFKKSNRDALRVRLKNVEIPGGIQDGDEVIVDIGDLRISGALDAKGRSESSAGERTDRIRVKRRSRTVVVEEGDDIPVYKLLVKSKRGDFADAFAAFGLENRDAKKEPLAVDVRIRVGRDCLEPGSECVDFRQNVVLFYNAKAGKKGKGKATVQTVPAFDCPLL